jgi:FKBP-type peptidyl-prolyl cis-trans isomerase SlyD
MRTQVVSFHCILKNKIGQVLSSTFNQDVITDCPGQGDFLRGLSEGLKNLTKGEKRQIHLTADQAYGFYDTALVFEVPRSQLVRGEALMVGDEILHASWEGGSKVFRVIECTASRVTLDGNHPLAGQDLIFDIEATDARDATIDEIAESNDPGAGAPKRYLH